MSKDLKMLFYSNRSPKKGYSWETPPAKIPESEITETHTSEVLFIGGGISGLAGAARCQQRGLKVTIIDKNEKMFALAGQIAAVNSRAMAEKGITVDKKALAGDWMKVSGSRIQEHLLWLFINRSAEGFHWMLDLAGDNVTVGVYEAYKGPIFKEYQATHHIMKKKDSTKYTYGGGGMLACEILEKAFLEFGGELYRSTAAKYLEQDENGRVTGCIAQNGDGKYIRYQATRAVVLATGDCCDDKEMLEAFCPTALRPSKQIKRGGNTGDGQKMAYWVGAALDNPEWAPTIHMHAYNKLQGYFLHVNQLGKRFMNEDTWLQGKSIRCLMQPGGDYCFSIFDDKYAEEMCDRRNDIGGQGMAPLTVMGDTYDEQFLREHLAADLEKGLAFQADTLEELAEIIDVPADTLIKTVNRYNEIVASGDDVDFGKRTRLLTSVEKPPFYAIKWGPCLLDVFGGAQVDENLQVLDADAHEIPGLYATGNACGGMYHVDYPLLLNGNSYGRSLAYAMQLGDVLTAEE